MTDDTHPPEDRGPPPLVAAVRRFRLGAALVWLAAAACQTGAPGGSTGGDVITREQIAELALAEETAHAVVRQLKPAWLRARNPGNPGSGGMPIHAVVFLDNQELGVLDHLNDIPSHEIERIEYLDFRDATIRYGTGYPGGILRVVTVR